MADPKLIERVQKLLSRTTEAGCTTAEAETAFAMASEIMARHNIDMATVETHLASDEAFIEETVSVVPRSNSLTDSAMAIVKSFFFVEGYFVRKFVGGKKTTHHILFGTPSNVAAASHVFRQFVSAGEFAWLEYKTDFLGRFGHKPNRKAKYDFCEGFFHGVARKLWKERQSLVAEEPATPGTTNGTALALIESRLSEAYKTAHPGMRTVQVKGREPVSRGAYQAGIANGTAFNPSRPIGGEWKKIGKEQPK